MKLWSVVTPVVIQLAACGGSPSPAPTPPAHVQHELPPATDASDDDASCGGEVEDSPPGHHDRYAKLEQRTELWGYVNKQGTWVIPPRFAHAYEFRPGGLAAVIDDANKMFAFIDPSGKVIAQAYAFDNGPDYFQAGFARITDGTKIGFIDDRGRIVIPPRYDAAESFCGGKAEVELAGERFTIDTRGQRIR